MTEIDKDFISKEAYLAIRKLEQTFKFPLTLIEQCQIHAIALDFATRLGRCITSDDADTDTPLFGEVIADFSQREYGINGGAFALTEIMANRRAYKMIIGDGYDWYGYFLRKLQSDRHFPFSDCDIRESNG